jgi:hypothetical protein
MVLDQIEPARLKISRKRWANLRSDLTAAIEASGLRPMFKTGRAEINETWARLLQEAGQPKIGHGLARFARWASERQIAPKEVDEAVIDRFIADLEAASLIRNLPGLRKRQERSWNLAMTRLPGWGLRAVKFTCAQRKSVRVPWSALPHSFRKDVDDYLAWTARLDPLDENARSKPLAPKTRRLRFDHVHSAVAAAVEDGTGLGQLTSLSALVEPQMFKSILRYLWEKDG